MKKSGSEGKKNAPAKTAPKDCNRIGEICRRVRQLLREFTDEELACIMFEVENPEPSPQEVEDAMESIEGPRLKNREWTITQLTYAALDFGIADEPPQDLSHWLDNKQNVRAFILERLLG